MRKLISLLVAILFISVSYSFAQETEELPGPPDAEIQEDPASAADNTPQEQQSAPAQTVTPNRAQASPDIFAPAQIKPQAAAVQPIQGKISLDIKGMDIVDVLKMLATRANINIVVGKNVSGRVTLFLKDINVWEALEMVILSNELAYEKNQDVVNVMTQRDYELQYGVRFQDRKQAKVVKLNYAKAADLAKALGQIKTNVGKVVIDEASNTVVLIDTPEKVTEMEAFISKTDLPVQTRIFGLNYAQADKLNTKIQEILTKGVGVMKIDERTNKIAISDYPQKLDEIANIIKAFDEKTPQVLIDAQVIEIKPSDKFEMGVDWDYWIRKHFKVAASLPINKSNALLLSTANSTVDHKGEYKGIIDMLRTIGDTKILSSPRIMVLNNQEAKILVGTKDAYITSSVTQTEGNAVTAETVNFVETGIKLYVTPTINRDGFVTMKIKPEVSSAETKSIISQDKKTDIPIVTSSEAETTVMVKDGVTIIIGGLQKDERKKSVKKIPLFGDIPGVGFLFRSTSDELKKTDLIILLTPHIMGGDTSYTEFSEIIPKDGATARMDKGTIVTEKVKLEFPDENPTDMVLEKYYATVTGRIDRAVLHGQPKGEKGEVEVIFILSREGKLLDEPIVARTTNPNLKIPACEAVKHAAPYPVFPKSLDKEKHRFRITLYYE
jgi:type II secretory pathway component GspD/PulD (secretin)